MQGDGGEGTAGGSGTRTSEPGTRNPEAPRPLLGLDLGGTWFRGLLVAGERVLARARVPAEGADFARFERAGSDLIARLAAHAPAPPEGVGVAVAGAMDPARGIMERSPNLPALDGRDLRAALTAAAGGRPVALENDANAFALAEHRRGAGRGTRHLVALTLGTGVGGGVIIDGRLMTGADRVGAELGHWPLNFDGRRCGCGRRGCAEAYVSGRGLEGVWRDRHPEVPATAAELFARFGAGDPAVAETMEGYFTAFAALLGGLITVFNPECVVLGGALAANELLWRHGVPRVAAACFTARARVDIRRALLGDEAGALGAALVIEEALRTIGDRSS